MVSGGVIGTTIFVVRSCFGRCDWNGLIQPIRVVSIARPETEPSFFDEDGNVNYTRLWLLVWRLLGSHARPPGDAFPHNDGA